MHSEDRVKLQHTEEYYRLLLNQVMANYADMIGRYKDSALSPSSVEAARYRAIIRRLCDEQIALNRILADIAKSRIGVFSPPRSSLSYAGTQRLVVPAKPVAPAQDADDIARLDLGDKPVGSPDTDENGGTGPER